MNNDTRLKFRLAYVMSMNSGEIPFFLGACGLMLSLGIFFATDLSSFDSMFAVANPIAWKLIFIVYSAIKFFSCFFRTTNLIRTINSFVGLWSWTYVFLSFVVFSSSVTATDFILLLPILAEIWSMLSLPQPRKWRTNDRRKKS